MLFFAALFLTFVPRATAAPRFDKAVVVILENTDYEKAIQQPFLLNLSTRGALLTDYHGIGHPSQPNYVALVSGDTQGVKDDGVVALDAKSLVDLLEAKGRTWKVYAEGYPGNCDLHPRHKRYARKHVPLLSFKNVQADLARCRKVVPGSEFFVDLSSASLPDFSLYIPDMRDDGHNTGVLFADKWLRRVFGPVVDKLPAGALLAVTFDEDSNTGGTNRVYASLVGSMVVPGSSSDERYTHYSLLRTLEDNWELGDLGANDAQARPISGVWK